MLPTHNLPEHPISGSSLGLGVLKQEHGQGNGLAPFSSISPQYRKTMGKWMSFYLAHAWVPTGTQPANHTHVMLQSKTEKT